ncbi:MAG: NADP-dependent isocitrate dehydrogenase, partial [Pseudomonadota bacterium]|nr:NADP-dependent isocitrate dehydrogenase [Pseudomonadota bacterium]
MAENKSPDILYTIVDEAPELASASFLPIIRKFVSSAGITVGTPDISLAGRIIATFPEKLTDAQRQSDDLAALGELVKTPDANVIKLPNISASVPQLVAAITELQGQGYDLPNYPEEPSTDEEKAVRARYDAIKGSAVNPVLREGNSDRRSAKAVKNFAQNNPHSMGEWVSDSKTKVSSMPGNDFYANEVSATITAAQAGDAKIEFVGKDGAVTVLKDAWPLAEGTVADATFMSAKALGTFLAEAIEDTKADGTMFSLHMKATMMKVSDPIIFGHGVRAWFAPLFEKYGETFATLGVNPNNGFGDAISKMQGHADEAAFTADVAEYLSGIA